MSITPDYETQVGRLLLWEARTCGSSDAIGYGRRESAEAYATAKAIGAMRTAMHPLAVHSLND